MNERLLVEEWYTARRHALQMFPVALAMLVGLMVVVVAEDLIRSEFGFVAGLLVGVHAYWALLEAMTVVRIGRLLRKAAASAPVPDAAGS